MCNPIPLHCMRMCFFSPSWYNLFFSFLQEKSCGIGLGWSGPVRRLYWIIHQSLRFEYKEFMNETLLLHTQFFFLYTTHNRQCTLHFILCSVYVDKKFNKHTEKILLFFFHSPTQFFFLYTYLIYYT